jgi:hypothetical protein
MRTTTNLNSEKISLIDLKDKSILHKIKRRCIQSNPPGHNVFEDSKITSGASRNQINFRTQNVLNTISPRLDGTKSPKHGTSSPRQGISEVMSLNSVHENQLKVENNLNSYIKKNNLENTKFTRSNLKDFLKRFYELEITDLTAMEGLLFCRGKALE